MSPLLRIILRFLICTAIVFAISYVSLLATTAYEQHRLESRTIGTLATAIFMLLNFPLWIMGHGADIFYLAPFIVNIALLLDAAFYGLVLAAWFSNSTRKGVPPPTQRRSLE